MTGALERQVEAAIASILQCLKRVLHCKLNALTVILKDRLPVLIQFMHLYSWKVIPCL